jgi:hypothetical protein
MYEKAAADFDIRVYRVVGAGQGVTLVCSLPPAHPAASRDHFLTPYSIECRGGQRKIGRLELALCYLGLFGREWKGTEACPQLLLAQKRSNSLNHKLSVLFLSPEAQTPTNQNAANCHPAVSTLVQCLLAPAAHIPR